jgi:ferredoxin
VRELMDKAVSFITRDCICRKEQRLLGNDCGKPQGNCISFSSLEGAFDGDYHGRIVDRTEAEKIMKEAAEAGLVHSTMNMTDEVYHFCNCCPECCGLIRGTKRFNKPGVLAKSNFYASVDPDECVSCGTCADERCPMEAVSEGDDAYEVNRDRCIGCGVCVPTCPSEAIKLVRKSEEEHIKAPDNMIAWMMERSMSTGKSLERFM